MADTNVTHQHHDAVAGIPFVDDHSSSAVSEDGNKARNNNNGGVDAFGNDSMWANSFYNQNESFASALRNQSIAHALRSPFVRELARHRKTHRWCTPSIIPDLYLPKNIDMEYSISVAAFGSHLSMTGLLGDVATRAATARWADRCYYSVAGTTTSNHKVMCALSRAFCGLPVLACRNVHHSITHSSSMFGVPLRFLDSGGYCPQYEAVLPPTPAELERQLKEDSEIAAVLVTSPTYEGVIADVEGLAAVAHKYGRILWVDQAWGSHLGWSDAVPKSALQLGADFCTESTHKTGGAMQGASLLLWKRNERTEAIEPEMYDAHCEHETTSPNFPIIASIDAALYRMTVDQHMVKEAVACANDLRELLSARSAAPVSEGGLAMPMPAMTMDDVMEHATDKSATYFLDPMRSNFAVPCGVSAFELASWLDKHGIVCEKNGLTSILFIATYQLPHDAPVKACALILRYLETVKALNDAAERNATAAGANSDDNGAALRQNLHAPLVSLVHHDTQLVMSAFPPCDINTLATSAEASGKIRSGSAGNASFLAVGTGSVQVLQEQQMIIAAAAAEAAEEAGGADATASNANDAAATITAEDVAALTDAPLHLVSRGGIPTIAAVPSDEIVNGEPAAIITPVDGEDTKSVPAPTTTNSNNSAADNETAKIHKALNALVAPQWLLNASTTRAVKVGPSARPSRSVPFWEAEGKVAGETVECYPPGIPVIIPGYRITKEQLCYLDHMQKAGAHIVCTDKTMERLRVRTDVE